MKKVSKAKGYQDLEEFAWLTKKREREIQELKRRAAQAKIFETTHGDYRSRSHALEKCRGGSQRKKRDISPTPKKGRSKKHQRDR